MGRNSKKNYKCNKSNANDVNLSSKPPRRRNNSKPHLVVNVLISETKEINKQGKLINHKRFTVLSPNCSTSLLAIKIDSTWFDSRLDPSWRDSLCNCCRVRH